jgi:sterol desaturase/sphingolipid hydroxylase (fatty acid hydroxylase superfamily)
MDWLVNTHAHPLDMVFTRLCGFIPMYALGLAQPRPHSLDPVSLAVILLGTLWGFFIHANLNWRFGPLEWFVSTPAFHHWHHTYEEPINKNYSSMLPWIDRLFGTCHMPKAQWPARYGIESPVATAWAAQLLDPLLPNQSPAVPDAENARTQTSAKSVSAMR